VQGLAKSADERFAFDSYRRFIQMYSDVVLEVDRRTRARAGALREKVGAKLEMPVRLRGSQLRAGSASTWRPPSRAATRLTRSSRGDLDTTSEYIWIKRA